MTLVAGASRFLSQATLANYQGSTFDSGSVLTYSASSSLLDAGRGNAVRGAGLSARARALNNQVFEQNSASYNKLFSLSGGASATVSAATIQIEGLRATAVTSRNVFVQDDGSVSSSALGSEVDTEA